MEHLFLQVLNMSLTGSFVILAVMLARLLLKKAPRKFSCWLWAVVGFRLLCPVSFSSICSILGLLPQRLSQQPHSLGGAVTYIPENIGLMARPQVNTGIPGLSDALSQALPAPTNMGDSVNPMQIVIFLGTVLWLVGMVVCLVWAVVSHWRLRGRLRKAVLLRDNIWECDQVRCPFILGWFRPRIYIPFGLEENLRQYILAHETCHIRKKDHIVKSLAWVILSVHWFNPLCHVAFRLLEQDMEMRCDEEVLRQHPGIAKIYSTGLLSFGANHRFVSPGPLAFGESGVKARIRHVLNWKQPGRWVAIPAIFLCAVVLFACAANPPEDTAPDPVSGQQSEESAPPETLPTSPTRTQETTPTETLPAVTEPAGMGQFFTQEEAISSAILSIGPGSGKDFDYRCESHIVLSEAIACGEGADGWCGCSVFDLVVLYQEYNLSEAGIETVTENLSLMSVTVDNYADGTYGLSSWYHPDFPGEDGRGAEDVFSAFAMNVDLNTYLLPLKQACYEKAVWWGQWDGKTDKVIPMDTVPILEGLLETILSSPLESSNPGAYWNAHPAERMELLYYGNFTLQYIYDAFLEGGQTGLQGHIFRFLLDDLTGLPLEQSLWQEQGAPWTGQDYFDLWAAEIQKTYGQQDPAELRQEQYPVWLLLQLMNTP